MPLPSDPADPQSTPSEAPSGEAIARRKLLQQAGWVLPAIVTTVTVRARAAQATCTPTCSPATTPTCNPGPGGSGPGGCPPRP